MLASLALCAALVSAAGFDQGPDAGLALDRARQAASAQPSVKAKKTLHYPFQEELCSACHLDDGPPALREPLARACFDCHSDAEGALKRKTVHKPFAEGKCASCHDPHESAEKALLRGPAHVTCRACHPKIELRNHPVVGHPAYDRRSPPNPWEERKPFSCVSCHEPHGTDWSKLLRWDPRGSYGPACQGCHDMLKPRAAKKR